MVIYLCIFSFSFGDKVGCFIFWLFHFWPCLAILSWATFCLTNCDIMFWIVLAILDLACRAL